MNNQILTRDAILGMDDITVKLIEIPNDFRSSAWAGKAIYIRQLSRAEQDAYLKRQFGGVKLKQDRRGKEQEISQASVYGHDAWLVVRGVCDERGNPIFKAEDETILSKKNGEAIGWIALQIVEFSGMKEDVDKISGERKTEEEQAEEEIKN